MRPACHDAGGLAGPDRHRQQRIQLRPHPGAKLTALYAPLIAGRPAFISFQTAAELRYGAIRRAWGPPRLLKREAKLAQAEIIHPGHELVAACALLRSQCAALGHALTQKDHNADLWIAATAIRLGVSLVSNDGIFRGVPGLVLETVGT